MNLLTLLITNGILITAYGPYPEQRCYELAEIFNNEHPTKDYWAFCEATNR